MSRRTQRIEKLIQRSLTEFINYRLSDPRIDRQVIVTGVEVAPDLTQAIVRLSASGASEPQMRTIMRGLDAARGKRGRLLGEVLTTRHVPRLDLRMDVGAIRARQTLAAIDEAMRQTPDRPADDPSADSDPNTGQENNP
jgi:ribosome-binding factor A